MGRARCLDTFGRTLYRGFVNADLTRLEILAALDEAEASLARGEGIPITEESMKALAEETKLRLRRRIAKASKQPTA